VGNFSLTSNEEEKEKEKKTDQYEQLVSDINMAKTTINAQE
jgi:hypothetical protein